MSEVTIRLGQHTRCMISGAHGIAVAKFEHITDGTSWLIQPLAGPDGKRPDTFYVHDSIAEGGTHQLSFSMGTKPS